MKQIHFESIDSTNTYIKNNYNKLDNETFVSSVVQTQGRGRNNRKWNSDGSNLLFSLLLKNEKYFSLINAISIISAYSILKVLQDYKINNLSIKWPNDIYADGKKICGILLEAVTLEKIECLIIGVGLNVNQIKFDDEYIHEPTSMKSILDHDVNLDDLKSKIYQRLMNDLSNVLSGKDYYSKIKELDYLKDKNVYALINNEKKQVLVKGINKDYTLCVEYENKEFSLNSGEISFHI